MNATIFKHGLILIAGFFAIWFIASRYNYVDNWDIRNKGSQLEEKVGDMIWKDFSRRYDVVEDTTLTQPVVDIIQRICDSNSIDFETYRLHFVQTSEVNAFALPNRQIVVLGGMIQKAENASQLAGVLAHEIGHVEENHIMDKLIREVGLSVLVSMTTGGGPETIGQVGKIIVGYSYDRSTETEADLKALEYLKNARINPEELSHLFYAIGQEQLGVPEWLSTHPDPISRAEELATLISTDTISYDRLMSEEEWSRFQKLWKVD